MAERTFRIVINDQALALSELEAFATEASVLYATPVDIRWAWGGPAAGGMGGGPPEIAVLIIGGEILRRVSGDAYHLLKEWCATTLAKVRTRNGARYYMSGAMGIEFVSDKSEVRIVLCAPAGTSANAFRSAWERLDADLELLIADYDSSELAWVYLWWNETSSSWDRVDTPRPAMPGLT